MVLSAQNKDTNHLQRKMRNVKKKKKLIKKNNKLKFQIITLPSQISQAFPGPKDVLLYFSLICVCICIINVGT